MPVRSSSSRVFRWPERAAVLAAARAWAEEVGRADARVERVVLFGSYAKGTDGVGSDLDLLVEVGTSDEPYGRRAGPRVHTRLPVPADVVIYTRDELAVMRSDGRRFAREVDAGATLWTRLTPESAESSQDLVEALSGDERLGEI